MATDMELAPRSTTTASIVPYSQTRLGGWHERRLLALSPVFVVLAGLAAVQTAVLLISQDASAHRVLGSLLLAIAAFVAAAASCRCTGRSLLGLLRMPFFWRWLLGGWIVVFLVLGLAVEQHAELRYLCRGACVFWTALMLLACVPRRPMQPIPRAGRLIDLLLGNLVLIVVLAESLLRIVALCLGPERLLLDHAGGYRLTPGVYPHGLIANSLGFPDEEFVGERTPGVRRVLWLGDSFSVATALSHEENYVTRIERGLMNVEVFNLGVCGTGPRQYADLLGQLGWRYQPDLVVVPVFIGNDITEPIRSPSLLRFDPNAFAVQRVMQRAIRLTSHRWHANAAVRGQAGWDLRAPLPEATYLRLEAGRLAVCHRNPSPSASPSVSPSMEANWQQALAALQVLVTDCQSHDVPVVFILLPDEFQVSRDVRERALAMRGWREEDLDIDLPQRRLAAWCAVRGVPCLDLLPTFAGSASPSRQRGESGAWLPHDTHWNAAGHKLAAATILPWLLAELRNERVSYSSGFFRGAHSTTSWRACGEKCSTPKAASYACFPSGPNCGRSTSMIPSVSR
jgi:hypothetical protein